MSMIFRSKRILAGTGSKIWDGRSCPSSKSLAIVLETGATLVVVAALIAPPKIQADNDDETTTVSVDVRQVGSTNSQNNVDPSKPITSFERGDTFILGGDIYPSGTIQRVPAGVTASTQRFRR